MGLSLDSDLLSVAHPPFEHTDGAPKLGLIFSGPSSLGWALLGSRPVSFLDEDAASKPESNGAGGLNFTVTESFFSVRCPT